MIQGHDAGVPGLNHANGRAAAKPHLVEASNEVDVSADFADRPRLAGSQEMKGNNV
jgi:hypothetical protein